ncbi:MAG: YlxR family protein [Firmicutes bacterium]|nr:YlxR family protein [Bacillota bacterium]
MVRVRKVPQRMCVGCQEMRGKKELIRIVRTPTGEIVLDPTGKKSGRGAYICPVSDCLEKAIKKKQLERALNSPIEGSVLDELRIKIKAQSET